MAKLVHRRKPKCLPAILHFQTFYTWVDFTFGILGRSRGIGGFPGAPSRYACSSPVWTHSDSSISTSLWPARLERYIDLDTTLEHSLPEISKKTRRRKRSVRTKGRSDGDTISVIHDGEAEKFLTAHLRGGRVAGGWMHTSSSSSPRTRIRRRILNPLETAFAMRVLFS